MKLTIDNIDMTNNIKLIMNNNQLGEQLINLSLQLLNNGIQGLNFCKNIINNFNNYVGQLILISQQINLLINENIIDNR